MLNLLFILRHTYLVPHERFGVRAESLAFEELGEGGGVPTVEVAGLLRLPGCNVLGPAIARGRPFSLLESHAADSSASSVFALALSSSSRMHRRRSARDE